MQGLGRSPQETDSHSFQSLREKLFRFRAQMDEDMVAAGLQRCRAHHTPPHILSSLTQRAMTPGPIVQAFVGAVIIAGLLLSMLAVLPF